MLKSLSLWARLVLVAPAAAFRFMKSEGRSALRFSVVRASWGKRWFLGFSRPVVHPVTELSFRVNLLQIYREELMAAINLGALEGMSRPTWCRCATSEHHQRFMSMYLSDSQSPPIAVTLSRHGNLVVVDGLRRLAIEIVRGRSEIETVFVAPVKMMSMGRGHRVASREVA